MARKLDFRISTGLKDIIGKELITEAHTAIFELVKNAYDADAASVKIVFKNIAKPEMKDLTKILIIDDGGGMSYDDIKNKWLFVGYSAKKIGTLEADDFRDKISNKKRILAGAKGIGRFSVDRLGWKTNLYTKKASEPKVHKIQMDWKMFEGNQNEQFQDIDVEYDTLDRFPKLDAGQGELQHGTILEIFPLADVWDRQKLVKLKKYLQRLINPTQMQSGSSFEITIVADEFVDGDKKLERANKKHETVNGKITNIVFEKMGIKTTQIRCSIQSKITTEMTDKGKFIFRTEESNHYEGLHDINIHVFYLNPEAKKAFTRVMGIPPIQFGSIFLYKNGFRIHPYGEEKDDWLNLEKRKSQGYSRYLATRELLGRIEVNGNQSGFREVSSRHGGVVESKELKLLLEFMQTRVIRWLERYVVEGLDWDKPDDKRKKSDEDIKKDSLTLLSKFTDQIKDPNKHVEFNHDLLSILQTRMASNLPEVFKNINALASFVESKNEKATIKNYARQVMSVAKAYAEERAKQELKSREKEILFLKKSHSTDAKLVEDYTHWINIATGKINGYLRHLASKIREKQDAESTLLVVEKISKENQRVATVASIISKANFNLQVKEKTLDIVAYITQYITNIIQKWSKRIQFVFINHGVEFTTTFKPLEIAMMIDNFVSNSRKANARTFTLKFSVDGQALRILVSDDGAGISGKSSRLLFKRGFTTTNGSGIGLNHIQSLIHKMNGSVEFLGNGVVGMNRGACFEVIINDRRR